MPLRRFLVVFAVLVLVTGLAPASYSHVLEGGQVAASMGLQSEYLSKVPGSCDADSGCCVAAHCLACAIALPASLASVTAAASPKVTSPVAVALLHSRPVAPEKAPPRPV